MIRVDGHGWTVYRGDCLDVMRSLGRVDVILTDPPYSPHVHKKSRQGALLPDAAKFSCRFRRATEFGFDAIEPWQVVLASAHFARLVRRWVVVFSDFELSPVWRAKMTRFGLQYIRTGAWWKIGGTPQFSGDRPSVGFEALTICHPPGRKAWNGGGHAASWEYPAEGPGDAFPTVWRYPIEANRAGNRGARVHTAQKPGPLLVALVDAFSCPEETVLDAFMGVATAGVAALRRGRRYVGIERDPRWFDVAVERLRAEQASSTLQATRAGQVPLFGDAT